MQPNNRGGFTDPIVSQKLGSEVITSTTNFDDILSSSDTTVQLALDTLDDGAVNVAGDTITGTLNIEVPTATSEALILKTTDDDTTKNLFELQESTSTYKLFSLAATNSTSFLSIKQADGTAVFDVDTTNRKIVVTSGTTGQSTIGAGLIINNDSGSGAINDFIVNSANLTAILVDASADTLTIGVNTTIADAKNIVLNTTTGTKIGTSTSQKLAFYNSTPVIQPTALTTTLTQITHTGPSTPDYAIATPIDSGAGSAWGFSTQDEFETVMSVILNLQSRVDELETKLQSLGLLA